tara:strand:+ start:87 stop:347 length:261 start_codon:yes stop_codon:yes gene_type:complete
MDKKEYLNDVAEYLLNDKIQKKIFEALLNETELLSKEGVSTAQMSRGLASFLVELVYDTAPTQSHATHLILSAVNKKLEKIIDQSE